MIIYIEIILQSINLVLTLYLIRKTHVKTPYINLNRNQFFDDVLANRKPATTIYNKYMNIIDNKKDDEDIDSLDFWNTKDIIYSKPIDLGIDS